MSRSAGIGATLKPAAAADGSVRGGSSDPTASQSGSCQTRDICHATSRGEESAMTHDMIQWKFVLPLPSPHRNRLLPIRMALASAWPEVGVAHLHNACHYQTLNYRQNGSQSSSKDHAEATLALQRQHRPPMAAQNAALRIVLSSCYLVNKTCWGTFHTSPKPYAPAKLIERRLIYDHRGTLMEGGRL